MKFLSLLIGFLNISLAVFAQTNHTVIVLKDKNDWLLVSKQTSYLEDKTGKMTIRDVVKVENQAKFIQNERDILHFMNSQNWFWIRIEIENQSVSKDWVLEIPQAKVAWLDLFFEDESGAWQEIKNGFEVPTEQKYKQHYFQVFPLRFQQTKQVFYLHTKANMQDMPVKIWTPQAFETFHLQKNMAYGFFFGIMFFIILNNLAFGLLTRRKIYLVYVGVVTCYTFIAVFLSGYAKLFFDFNVLKGVLIFNFLGLIALTQYAKLFLNIPHSSRLGKILNALSIISGLIFLSVFFADPVFLFLLMQVLGGVVLITLALSATFAFRRAEPFSQYYLLAISFFAVLVFLEIAHGNIGKPHYFYLAHLEWGFLFEVSILAYGLNRRFDFERKQLQKAKDDAQNLALAHAQENARLLEDQNNILEQKVMERTEKLQIAYEEIQVINEELHQTQEETLTQRDALEIKNGELEIQRHRTKQSIESAKLIQNAILPTQQKLNSIFAENFVIFMPKDVVSGDFYMVNQIGNKRFLIAADCTGHGISGAFMTMIGSTLLDRVINVSHIYDPKTILEKLHIEIQFVLQQEQTGNTDGMDIGVLVFEEIDNQTHITFSAAKRPLYYWAVGQKEVKKIAGSRKMVGGYEKSNKKFENQTLTLERGSSVYLCTDGYADQNDLERNRFSEKRLINVLEQIQKIDLLAQKTILKDILLEHKAGTEQRDDILVVGVKV